MYKNGPLKFSKFKKMGRPRKKDNINSFENNWLKFGLLKFICLAEIFFYVLLIKLGERDKTHNFTVTSIF